MKKVSASIIFAGLLAISPVGNAVASDTGLPEEFIDSQPRIQLYMAYAEFKMGHHDLARQMWLNIGGSGRSEALFNLANLYTQGVGVEKDPQRGIELYRESAEAGSRAAAYQLGLIYLHSPVFKNRGQARQWLTVAALDGDSDAADLLASMQSNDPADPLSQVEALLIAGDSDQALVLLQLLAAASPSDYRAMTRLAWLYESGLAVERDIDRAAGLFKQAAEAGNAEAQYALSVMYQTGVGQAQDDRMAQQWLMRSAAQNYPPAINKLAATAD
ncbi:tetratricopeptide repeat protein [uncultured Amphritea sp.]|uniref:tetratricopeptide repeat protein n=1 Tax=uncultured Amphritea sp. TaxID=981605 RepID=UPI0025F2996D|nr:tetratricopeptide repeat protein [uncultured Amphritea sp.]